MKLMKPTVLVATCFICVPGLAAEPTADDYLTFFKPIIGEWNATFRSGDSISQGELTLSLSPTKGSIIESARGFGPIPAFDGVSGFDPETKSWKSLFFNAKGECVTRYCCAPKLKGNEASFQVRFLTADPTGQVTKETATW